MVLERMIAPLLVAQRVVWVALETVVQFGMMRQSKALETMKKIGSSGAVGEASWDRSQ